MKTETKTAGRMVIKLSEGTIPELIKAIKKTTADDVLIQIPGSYNGHQTHSPSSLSLNPGAFFCLKIDTEIDTE